MSYFPDLSDYTYRPQFHRPGTKAIGWLGAGHEFPKQEPTEEILDLLWSYCTISVAQTRGIHECEFCPRSDWYSVCRKGRRLLLGTSEIRVFSRTNEDIYAAPTLIYHYIDIHRYRPPDEFISALRQGPQPPSQEYFRLLEHLQLPWERTSVPNGTDVGLILPPGKTRMSTPE